MELQSTQPTVIGPINKKDWLTMRTLVRTIPYMKKKNPVRYAEGIEMEEKWYKELKQKYLH